MRFYTSRSTFMWNACKENSSYRFICFASTVLLNLCELQTRCVHSEIPTFFEFNQIIGYTDLCINYANYLLHYHIWHRQSDTIERIPLCCLPLTYITIYTDCNKKNYTIRKSYFWKLFQDKFTKLLFHISWHKGWSF